MSLIKRSSHLFKGYSFIEKIDPELMNRFIHMDGIDYLEKQKLKKCQKLRKLNY